MTTPLQHLLFHLVLFSLTLIGMGCGRPEPAPSAVAFTDDLERTVSIDQPARRVLTLAPNLTEIVFAAGAGGLLPAVSTADDWPPAIDTLPRYSTFPMDFEAIAAFAPDILLATDQINAPRDAETFADLGIATFFFSFSSLEDVARSIRATGELLGTETQADAAADSLEAAFATLHDRTSEMKEKPLVLLLNGDRTLYAFGEGSYTHDLIRLAGGVSATADLDAPAPVLSEEFVLNAKPDVVIGSFGEGYGAADLLALHPTWDVVPAVQNGRVYNLHGDFFQRPGPRLLEGARRLAQMLHPELFEPTSEATAAVGR